METLANPLIIAGFLALAIGLFIYAFFVPRNSDKYAPQLSQEARKNKLLTLSAAFGQELYVSLPQREKKAPSVDPRMESLLVRSGNPWNFTVEEFKFFRWVCAFLGFLVAWPVWGALSLATTLPWFAVVGGCTVFGFSFPKMKYEGFAKQRDLDFKRELPEALDLVIISLSGGMTFTDALRSSIPNMKDGVLKREFSDILRSVDSGRTLNESLERFGKKAPNESVQAFVQAVRQASDLNVPMVEVLESRAQASRDEFFALIHSKTASLMSRMMMILTPTLLSSLLIVVLVPSIASLLNSIG